MTTTSNARDTALSAEERTELISALSWATQHPTGSVDLSCSLIARLARIDSALLAAEKRAQYAENTLVMIRDTDGITLDGAQTLAGNYFDGRDALDEVHP